MRMLAADSALGTCSAALYEDGSVVAQIEEPEPSRQAELLAPMIDSLLRERGLSCRDMDRLACTVGPGGFTGIRIAMAAIKGIALATGLPVTGVTTLQAVACKAAAIADAAPAEMLVLLNAMRGQVYAQRFRRQGTATRTVTEPELLDITALPALLAVDTPLYIAGNCRELLTEAPRRHRIALPMLPDAAATAMAAASISGDAATPFLPLYIRPPDAKLPSPP